MNQDAISEARQRLAERYGGDNNVARIGTKIINSFRYKLQI